MVSSGISQILIILCVVLSAYFSATETAFNSVNRIRLKSLAEKGDEKAALVLKLLEEYDKLLTTILIGNNLVNIAATALATVIFVRMLGEDRGTGVATLVITLVLLIFGEVTPKSLAARFPERTAGLSAPALRVLMVLMTPLTALFSLWKKLLTMIVKDEEDRSITEDELLTMVDVAEDEGGINEQESALLRNSIDFMDQEAQDILTPRVDIEGVEKGESREAIAERFAETGYSRLPVYEGDLDHIVGILYQKDFYNKFYQDEGKDVSSIIRPVIFVSEHRKLGNLLRELQQKKMQIAVVLDEFGGTRGIVTMEDILEELVGEIWDEHDEVVNEIEKIADDEYLVMGGTNLEKRMDELERTTDSDALTVSGWVLEAGHLPVQGEELDRDGMRITVLEMEEKRVRRIRLRLVPQQEEDKDK